MASHRVANISFLKHMKHMLLDKNDGSVAYLNYTRLKDFHIKDKYELEAITNSISKLHKAYEKSLQDGINLPILNSDDEQ